MKRNYLMRALSVEMEHEQITQGALAFRCGITQTSVWRLTRGQARPTPETLKAITHCWCAPDANVRILVAHLRDEIATAGYDPESAVCFVLPDGSAAPGHKDLDTIRRYIHDPDVADLISSIAELVERGAGHRPYPDTSEDDEPSAAAETNAPYTP